ncbi:MAG: hypothetical protein JOY64_02800 [Alphaproteobacteria bacterium]|nr:hypothetical protein [Alphaproteobacteria bacterium]MBV8406531.1 hypothetical protein [Alphaproteobacteria bacterium]
MSNRISQRARDVAVDPEIDPALDGECSTGCKTGAAKGLLIDIRELATAITARACEIEAERRAKGSASAERPARIHPWKIW